MSGGGGRAEELGIGEVAGRAGPPRPPRATLSPAAAPPAAGPTAAPSAAARPVAPPAQAVWRLGVTRDERGRPALYFLTSDPDARDYYWLSKS